MRKVTLNFIVDLISFVDLLGLLFTAVIQKYILPPGTGGGGRGWGGGFGREVKAFWLLTRYEWGSIHFYLALLFIVLITAHILLHWTWIKNYFKTLFISKKAHKL